MEKEHDVRKFKLVSAPFRALTRAAKAAGPTVSGPRHRLPEFVALIFEGHHADGNPIENTILEEIDGVSGFIEMRGAQISSS